MQRWGLSIRSEPGNAPSWWFGVHDIALDVGRGFTLGSRVESGRRMDVVRAGQGKSSLWHPARVSRQVGVPWRASSTTSAIGQGSLCVRHIRGDGTTECLESSSLRKEQEPNEP